MYFFLIMFLLLVAVLAGALAFMSSLAVGLTFIAALGVTYAVTAVATS